MKIVDTYVVESVVRGYHMYKDIWNAVVGRLGCQQETGNLNGPYAASRMAVQQQISRKIFFADSE